MKIVDALQTRNQFHVLLTLAERKMISQVISIRSEKSWMEWALQTNVFKRVRLSHIKTQTFQKCERNDPLFSRYYFRSIPDPVQFLVLC